MPLNIVCFCHEVNNRVLVLFLMAGKKRASPEWGALAVRLQPYQQ
jgi:hypothetical protein